MDDEEPRRPLVFLPGSPFPDQTLQISGSPIRIVDHTDFDEETDHDSLTAAMGLATTLWRWCPDALHAWLDCEKYYACEWARRKDVGTPPQTTLVLARNDRYISLGHYNYNQQLLFGCDFGMPEDGPWVPLSGTIDSVPVYNKAQWPGLGGMLARDLLYNPRWKSGPNISHSFILSDSLGDGEGMEGTYPANADRRDPEVDPHWLYHLRSSDICQRCYEPQDAAGNCAVAHVACPHGIALCDARRMTGQHIKAYARVKQLGSG